MDVLLSIAISVLYLFLLSLVNLHGRYAKAGIGEKPLAYTSEVVMFILNLGLLGWILMTIVMVFFNWKLLVGLLVIGFLLGGFVFTPFTERLLALFYVALENWAKKKEKETKRK